LQFLHPDGDLDAGVWLRHLSHDNEPVVRIAAVATAAEANVDSLDDRLDQMARSDPSPTVCQLASYYRKLRKERRISRGD
jgi:hypothetical protein